MGKGKRFRPLGGQAVGLAPTGETTAGRLQQATALNQRGRQQEAAAVCREVLRWEPRNAKALVLLATIAYSSGQPYAAIDLTRAALEQNKRSVEACHVMGAALMALGRFEEALVCFERALGVKPGNAVIHRNRGNALLALGSTAAALDSYDKALRLAPTDALAHNNRGIALNNLGRAPEAVASWTRAVALDPRYHDALNNLATALHAQGHEEEALEHFRAAVALRPDSPLSQCNLGVQLLNMGDLAAARKAFEIVLLYDPENPTAKHLAAALRGDTTEQPPGAYVEKLFDGFSGYFDQLLLGRLRYTTPQQIVQALIELTPCRPAPWDVLDLGCGTGLSGAAVAAHARQLVGVDVSANMLEKARERNIYTRLVHRDIVLWMDAEPAHGYDVVLAADVFVYVGRLDEAVRAAERMLKPSGAFAFSVESLADSSGTADSLGEFQLNTSGRYSHSDAYLRRLASAHRFDIEKHARIEMRLERGVPVPGWIEVWRRR